MASDFTKPLAVKSGQSKKGAFNPYTGFGARKVPSKAVANMVQRRLSKKMLKDTKAQTRKNLGLGKMY
jgi:hypothetical protein|tara:strand:- start:551 stop:754 length:204 start_codon:yes stop_codon:yes gene_type:complete